ncbi:glycosyltransferase [bacterium]|nr:glycosyltransferase [bacterium]
MRSPVAGNSMPDPIVTFLLPVRNAARYLAATLKSLEAQTRRDFIVMAWDNGSTDDTCEILRSWIPSRLPGEVIADDPRTTLGECLAAMVACATTPWLARIDGDDLCLPQRIGLQLAEAERRPSLVGVGAFARVINAAGEETDVVKQSFSEPADLRFSLVYTNPLVHPAMLLRRDAVLEAGNYSPMSMGQDFDLWMRLSSVGPIANIPRILLHYRVHGESIGASRHGDWPALHHELLERHGPALFPGAEKEDIALVHRALSGFESTPPAGRAVGEAVIRLAVAARRAPAWKDTDFLATRAVWNAYARCVPRWQRSPLRLAQMLAAKAAVRIRA